MANFSPRRSRFRSHFSPCEICVRRSDSGKCSSSSISVFLLVSAIPPKPHICLHLHVTKVIIKPIWTYDIELWGCTSKSNVNIIQRFQSKTLRLIAGSPRYVSNQTLHADLSITTVEEERQKRVDRHFQRLQEHENQLAINLVDVRNSKRLKRIWPCDLRGE